MARFLNHRSLSREIISLFEEAEEGISIVSPFIKLHPDIKRVLRNKMDDDDFFIQVMYGKNESNLTRSLSVADLEFFKEFQNVYIHYRENLHAKYYANENKSIISSINLHEYSIQNNIEVGILLERRFLGIGGDNSIDDEAFEYFERIFDNSKPVFIKEVKKKKHFFGLFESTDGHEIEDNTKKLYRTSSNSKSISQKMGYCIRTGVKIPFNLKLPFTKDAYKSWNQYKNKDYKEKFCHFSGEPSNGETSFAKPILSKNWKKAMGKN